MRMIERWIADAKAQKSYELKIQVQSVIIGGAVGDALGVPYEFKERDTFTATDMVGYGTHCQPKGTWSDDTSLTLCLIENYVEGGTLSDLCKKFLAYRESGKWTPYGKCFDIGISTLQAIENYKNGVSPELCGGSREMDNGNGALMRIAPTLFASVYRMDSQYLIKTVRKYSEITHRHPRSVLGCIIYIAFLRRILFYENFDRALDMTVDFCNTILEDPDLRKELPYYKRILNKEIKSLERSDIISDGYVVNSLEASLWCFATTNSYQEAVLKAVNLGGDTDTIASITGTIAGLKYGIKSIPEEWVNQLARINDIKELCGKFSDYCFGIKMEQMEQGKRCFF